MTINAADIDKAVKSQWDKKSDDYWQKQEEFFRELHQAGGRWSPKPLKVGDYLLTLVESEGGPDENGIHNYWNFIFKVEGSDQLFKIDSDYDSYDGNEWYGAVYECEAYIEPVTRYRRK